MAERPFDEPVSEYASRDLVTVPPDALLHHVAELFRDRGVSAAAVSGADRGIVGMISSRDLLEAVELDLGPHGRARARPSEKSAADIMRTELVSVDLETPLREAAAVMVERRIHRVWVRRAAAVVGVLTAHDLMRAVLHHRVQAPLWTLMSAPVLTVALGEPIRTAFDRLAAGGTHGLVVVDGDAPVGVFTRTEAIEARTLPPDLLSSPVERVMSYEMIALDQETPLRRAAGHACVLHLRRVVALNGRRLSGIATGLDFTRYVATH
jgi:CBS domain-containing protein